MKVRFEWRKWFKLPKTKLVLVILVALLFGGLFRINQGRKNQVMDYLSQLSDGSGYFLKYERDALAGFFGEAPDLPEAEYEELYGLYDQAYDELDEYYRMVEFGTERQGQAYYLEFIQTLEQLQGKKMPIPEMLIEKSVPLSKAKMSYLKKHDLVMEESLNHPTGVRAVLEVMLVLTSVVGMFGFLLLFYDFFTFEYEHQQIRFIYTQPLKRQQLVVDKLFVVVGVTFSLVVSALLLAFFFGRLVSGEWGSLNYPVMLKQVGSEIEIFTIGKLLAYSGMNLLLGFLVTLMLLLIFSYRTRKSLLTLLLTAGVLLIPVVFSQVGGNSSWLRFTPLAPLNFSHEYVAFMNRGQLFSQTLRSTIILGGCLLLFCFIVKRNLGKWAREDLI